MRGSVGPRAARRIDSESRAVEGAVPVEARAPDVPVNGSPHAPPDHHIAIGGDVVDDIGLMRLIDVGDLGRRG